METQVRGPAGAVTCETRDLGFKWPQWHTLMFSQEIETDMRLKDVEKMLVQRARSVYWKKWAAKHEYEELKERAWLEPGPSLLRQKVKENWTDKHRNVDRRIFSEGGWTQKRLFDIGRSDVSQCQACQTEEGTEKHRLHHCPEWYEVRREIPEALKKSWSKKQEPQRSGSGKEVLLSILSVKAYGTGPLSMKKRESEKHKNWSMPAEGFKGLVAADGPFWETLASGQHLVGQWYS